MNQEILHKHVMKVCLRNIRRDAKICQECPFVELIEPIIEKVYFVYDPKNKHWIDVSPIEKLINTSVPLR